MPVPRIDIVQPIINRHREAIVTAVLGAWGDWQKSPRIGIWRCKRSRATFVWEQIIDRAHIEFNGSPNVRIINGHETFKFLLEEQVLFRFKKGDEAGLSVNVPTQLALAFHDHDQDLLGLADVQRVEVLYQLNWLETGISDVIVVGRDKHVVVWSYSLLDSAAGVVPLPIPAPSDGLPTTPARQLVRPRGASETRDRNRQG